MIPGIPANMDECQYRARSYSCLCGPRCVECGYGEHMSIHGGVIGKPGMVFGHEFKPGRTRGRHHRTAFEPRKGTGK